MLIMSNESERSDFVPMDYIFSKLGRIHDGIQVLKAYYPYHEKWSPHKKISEIEHGEDINFAWGYDYEDYNPFNLLVEGGNSQKQFEDIKRYGSDIHLTLTMDLSLSDQDIEKVVRSLTTFGRVFLRVNHECNGTWFPFNKFYNYKEVSDFFVRCHKIVKANSSNIFTVFSLSSDFYVKDKVVCDMFLRLNQDEMREALQTADYWSLDKYASLHYAWPYEETITPESKNTYFQGTVEDWWRLIEECYLNMIWHNGLSLKPLFINEFNTDSDVDGAEAQARMVGSVYDRINRGDFPWLAGITLYQFRDYGGLGLEKGNLSKFKETPSLSVYRDIIQNIHYNIRIEDWQEWPHNKYHFAWFNSDSIRGLCIRGTQDRNKFVNTLPVPVYFLSNEGQRWIRLDPKEVCSISGQNQFYILLPPYVDKNGKLQYTFVLNDFKNELNRMMPV